MKLDKATKSELLKMAVGQALGVVLICLAWAMMQQFDLSVLLGALYGAVVALAYFFSVCWSVTKNLAVAVREDTLEEQTKAVKGAARGGYMGRMMLVLAALLVAFKSPYTANIPAAIPFFLVRPIATMNNPFETKEEKSK